MTRVQHERDVVVCFKVGSRSCSLIVSVLYVVLLVTGEGYGFLQFAWLYPHVLVQLFIFSLCSSMGQVCVASLDTCTSTQY